MSRAPAPSPPRRDDPVRVVLRRPELLDVGRPGRRRRAPRAPARGRRKSSAPMTGAARVRTAAAPSSSVATSPTRSVKPGVVDRHRVAEGSISTSTVAPWAAAIRRRAPDRVADRLAGVGRDRPDGALELGRLGDDVRRGSRRDVGDGDDRGIEHVDLAGDERAQAEDDLGGDRDRVERRVRHRGVAAPAVDADPQGVVRGQHRAGPEGDRAAWIEGGDVERERRVRCPLGGHLRGVPRRASSRAPAKPSSPGWNMSRTVPARRSRRSSRGRVAPRNIATWVS